MDPISTLRSCLQLAKDIYDLKQKMDADDAACNMFFARVHSLNAPLEKLNNQSQTSLGSKKESLQQINDCLNNIMRVLNSRMKKNKSFCSCIMKAHQSFTGTLKLSISELNMQLDRCISAVEFCISVDVSSKLDSAVLSLQTMKGSLTDQLNEIAAALQAQSLHSSIETQFQRDPYPDHFDDDRSVLGKGAFGVTHRMLNSADGGVYAVKVISVNAAEKAGINKDMMVREAIILRDLNHKYLVKYYTSFFSKEGKLFNLVMELVSGGSLDDKIKDQSVTVPMIRQWLEQLAEVLNYLHNDMHLLHRDIKPDNILMSGTSIKLIDLGMACAYESSLSKMSKVGTQTYSSYEKAHGLSYDGRDDVWGAGCLFSELLTKSRLTERGGSLYEHNNVEVNKRRLNLIKDCMCVDTELGLLLSQMLETDVTKRIMSQDLLVELKRSPAVDNPMRVDLCQSSTTAIDSPILNTTSNRAASATYACVSNIRIPEYTKIAAFVGHLSWVRCIVHDAGQCRLYSASDDWTIKVWDTSSRLCLATLTDHCCCGLPHVLKGTI